MTTALLANSENAEDLAAAVLKFKDPLPEQAAEITHIVAELFAIAGALRELDDAITDRANRRRVEEIDEDKRVLLLSLECTFKDVQRLFGGFDRGTWRSNKDAYRGVWKDIQAYFKDESRNTLLVRLTNYKDFALDLVDVVVGSRRMDRSIDDMFERMDTLLEIQEERLEDAMNNLAVGTPRVRSWERRRPGLHNDASPPPAALGRRDGHRHGHGHGHGTGHATPTSPLSPHRFEFNFFSPQAPEVPMVIPVVPSSPSISTAATTSTASSSSASVRPPSIPDHWLPQVFGQNRPTTQFTATGSESICYGSNQHNASQKLRHDHDELLVLPFENNRQLEVRLWWRERDRRARMWCRNERGGHRTQCYQSITNLRILRKDSCLQICKPNARRKLEFWANLRFSSYERMVLFYCSFLALKAQDEGDPIKDLDDHILDGELPVFSGKIYDDSYQHALQIFKDENSGGIRLQASALRGPLKRCPVWTAFINYKIMAKSWNVLVEPRKVHLLDLTRYVFSFDYLPHLGPNGEHELHFLDSNDAKLFCDAIDDLANGLYG